MKNDDHKPLHVIEKWFSTRCDGEWEHHSGLILQTTDNPGWLITIDATISESALKKVTKEVRTHWNADCMREQASTKVYGVTLAPSPARALKHKDGKIKVYASSLEACVGAAAHVLEAIP